MVVVDTLELSVADDELVDLELTEKISSWSSLCFVWRWWWSCSLSMSLSLPFSFSFSFSADLDLCLLELEEAWDGVKDGGGVEGMEG